MATTRTCNSACITTTLMASVLLKIRQRDEQRNALKSTVKIRWSKLCIKTVYLFGIWLNCALKYKIFLSQILLRSKKRRKKSPVSGHRSAFFGNLLFVANQWNTWYMYGVMEPHQISHTQSMVAKRSLTNRANVHTPMWKSCLKHSTAEFQSNQQFWLQLDIVS